MESRGMQALRELVDELGPQKMKRIVTALAIACAVWVALVAAGVIVVVGGAVGWCALTAGVIYLLGVPSSLRRFDRLIDGFAAGDSEGGS